MSPQDIIAIVIVAFSLLLTFAFITQSDTLAYLIGALLDSFMFVGAVVAIVWAATRVIGMFA